MARKKASGGRYWHKGYTYTNKKGKRVTVKGHYERQPYVFGKKRRG